MKNLIIFMLCALPLIGIAQDATTKRFTSADKKYNDWSVYAFGGTSLIQTGDLTSINNGVGDWDFGYDFQFGVEKTINHAVGLIAQFQLGQTKQQYVGSWYPSGEKLHGTTEYMSYTLLGDISLTSLFRRFDNNSRYKWALHYYLGLGFIQYKAKSNALNGDLIGSPNFPGLTLDDEIVVTDQSAGLGSFYAQTALGLKYKLNRRIDFELKATYYFTGDEEFDGSGDPVFANGVHTFSPADIEESRDDNFITFGLGINVKLGKHDDHLYWSNPYKQTMPDIPPPTPVVDPCESGDADQDGVCDDWDKCLNTPLGARIDGSGCELDTDLDGIIDLYDRCVTIPGTVELQGCPAQIIEPNIFDGIDFALGKSDLRPISYPILDNAAMLIMKYGQGEKYIVEGHTDTRADDAYNLKLSQARVETVVNYLVSKGVPRDQLIPRGVGEADLLYPECQDAEKCKREGNEWKNEKNRRVVFKPANSR